MSHLRKACVLVLTATLFSCSPPERGGGTIFSDSAGITLAFAECPLWLPGEGWLVGEEPVLQIGVLVGPEEYQFTELVGAARLSDGRIVVADRGSSELRFFGPDGQFLHRVGRDGEGPGEFRRLQYVGVFQGDSIATFDWALQRVQIFGPGGEFARQYLVESIGEAGIPNKTIDIADGSTLTIRFVEMGSQVTTGIVRWPHELVAKLDLQTGRIDSISHVPGYEVFVHVSPTGGMSQGRYIFGKGNEFSAQAGRIAIISTDTFAVKIVGLDGSPELMIRREVEPEPATDLQFDRYVEAILQLVFPEGTDSSPEEAERFRRSLLNSPRASTLPILRSVKLDVEGNVWVEMYFHPGEDPPPYQVFRSDGTWLGEVAMPQGFDRGSNAYQAPSFQIGSDFILGVWKDELDVQYVRLYELVKG